MLWEMKENKLLSSAREQDTHLSSLRGVCVHFLVEYPIKLFADCFSFSCQEEYCCICLPLTIPICANMLSGGDTKVEFHLAQHICCNKLLKVKKKKVQSFNKISKIVLKFQVLDRHGNKTGLTREPAHWQTSHESRLGKNSLIGSLGNHPLTYSRAQGRNHGELSGKVSRSVCLGRTASACRRTRWALQPDSLTRWTQRTRGGSLSKFQNLSNLSAPRQIH